MLPFPLDHHSQGWDSAGFGPDPENPAITTEMEGGYTASRPRHTRTPRRTWKLTWKMTTDSNKLALEGFWDAVRGSSDAFTWVDPSSITAGLPAGLTYTVRFKPGSKLDMQYRGAEALRVWDITCEVEQI